MPTDRRAARRAALLALLDERQVDALVVTHLPNVRYLTGFTGSAGVALVLRQETVFLSDFRYRDQANAEVAASARVEIVAGDAWERVWQLLPEYAGVATLGFESQALTVLEAERLREGATAVSVRPVDGVVERLRQRKDADEVAAIRGAADLAHEALDAALGVVRAGVRERDVAVTLEAELRRRGSEWHPFPTIVASGPRSALPHAGAGDREIAAGDWLLLDFGARVDGYCADITRTVVVGARADQRQRALYQVVREAHEAACTGVHAGISGRAADALARTVIEGHGFGDAFGHSLGHGIGLEVHEGPRLSRTNEDPLPDRAVVTIEPGVYVPGWGGVRIEDDVLLGSDGAELLSDGDTSLRELT